MRPSDWTAVVTAAGDATRFRPFSTTVPKEMLPVGNQPAVEHVINECVDAGAGTVIVATRPGDLIVPSYLDVLRRDGIPVEAVAEDLGHGYGNGTHCSPFETGSRPGSRSASRSATTCSWAAMTSWPCAASPPTGPMP